MSILFIFQVVNHSNFHWRENIFSHIKTGKKHALYFLFLLMYDATCWLLLKNFQISQGLITNGEIRERRICSWSGCLLFLFSVLSIPLITRMHATATAFCILHSDDCKKSQLRYIPLRNGSILLIQLPRLLCGLKRQ